ncbi:MAG: phosphohistidine phosphatase SixA [Thermoanaerobaculia bacterium]
MLIVLFRHGIAEKKDGEKPDEERRLTDEGHRKMKRISKRVAKMIPDADAIYSSPLLRAWETAEWLQKRYERKLEIQSADALEPGRDPEEFRALLRRSSSSCAFFVGHEPHLSSLMLALTKMHPESEVALKKGGCYGLEMDGPDDVARLRFMLEPALLE